MAPVNIAGQPIAVTNELRRQGLDVTLVQYTAGEGHKYEKLEKTEGWVDIATLGFIVALGLVMVVGLLTATGNVTW